ncbi:STAS domain-containing protein [Amycolatopsis nalaikhensis]|uniref:Anti-sigma factor antagonist n=1 Tax=Amycolatopsis nalaikhensis TaxID=715472 RepID=A0ABY8XQH2_9PSEU|nr:STAS domain-containing protein [Amycolatopsis sp. 2-2]WIV57841.1 STAS domain-containing protein [Amycolatopsis sp. 2-2]
MTAVLPSVSFDRLPHAAAVLPGLQPGPEPLTVTAQPVPPGTVVLAVRGEVDLCTSPLLQDALLTHLRHASAPLVIDLTDVGFFAAAGLTVLVTARQAAVTAGVRLCVVANSRPVLLPLTITGMDRVLDIHPDLAHARLCRSG